jgi:hypothetical protein
MVTLVILLPVLFVLAAMAINLSYIQVINTKVQIVTAASVKAAGRVYVQTGSESDALLAAQQMAALNPIQSLVVPIEAGDLEYGTSKRDAINKTYQFKAGGTSGNAVRLTTNSFAAGSGDALRPFFPMFSPSFEIRPVCTATNSQTTLDVALIVDRSGSMAFAADESTGGTPAAAPSGWSFGDPVPPNSRWLDLVASVSGFCDELAATAKIEKIALVSYAADVRADVELEDDYKKINDANARISAAFDGGMTNVGGGIMEGIVQLAHPSRSRPWATNALVLMSDGKHNSGTDPLVAAADAAAQGIPIYTVSFSSEADQALMQQIADKTGGTAYHAADAQQLNEAFRNIARRLPSMLTE